MARIAYMHLATYYIAERGRKTSGPNLMFEGSSVRLLANGKL